MNDMTINVKQIGNYTTASAIAAGDLVLIQQGGLGGPYASITAANLVSTALNTTTSSLLLEVGQAIEWGTSGALIFDGTTYEFGGTHNVYVGGILSNAGGISSNGNIDAVGTIYSSAGIGTGGAVNAVGGVYDNGTRVLTTLNGVSSFNSRVGDIQLQLDDILRAGGAPVWNPHFGGAATAPTIWNPQDNTDAIATTAFVQAAICDQLTSGHVVLSYNGRGGDVVPIASDITTALSGVGVYAYANTPPLGDASKKIATTSFVDQSLVQIESELQDYLAGVAAELDKSYAPLDSPQFTGIPTAPTAAQTVNSGQLATTAFVHAAVTASTTGVSSFNTRTGAVTLIGADITAAGGALLLGPTFTGTPSGPTAAPGTNTTQLATTAFVAQAVSSFAQGVTSFNTRTGAVVLTTADVTAVGGALLASPAFSGAPTAPTATAGTSTTQLATTAFVTAAVAAVPASVSSFNGRTGAITFQSSDISAVGGALLISPNFTGAPTAPTATVGDSSTKLATTAFVTASISASAGGVTTFNGRNGAVVLQGIDLTGAGGALLAGPTFTGVPAAPTATAGTNTTQIATTAFVQTAIAAAPGGVTSFNGRQGAITFLASDVSAVGGALLANPSFTGAPTAPTPSPGNSSTQIATTNFVATAIAAAGGVQTFNGRAGAVTLTAADLVSAGGAIVKISDTAPAGQPDSSLWWESDTGMMYIRYNDGTSTQWVTAVPVPDTSVLVAKTGDTMTGPLTLSGDPTAALQATTKQYSDKAIRTDATQSFTAAQQAQGRQNLYAAPFDAMGFSGMQVNGGMTVSQELGTAGVTGVANTAKYIVDGWQVNCNGSMVLAGLTANSQPIGVYGYVTLQVTTTAASIGAGEWAAIVQPLEGWRWNRLGFGGVNASPVSIGFWAASHRPGNYSVALRANYLSPARGCAQPFTVNSADTWEWKTVTFPGDTVGAWKTDQTLAVGIWFTAAAGTSLQAPAGVWTSLSPAIIAVTGQPNMVSTAGDTLSISGVIILPGTELPSLSRMPFVVRPQTDELMLCRRYFQRFDWAASEMTADFYSTASAYTVLPLPVAPTMRATPTMTTSAATFSLVNCSYAGAQSTANRTHLLFNLTGTGRGYATGNSSSRTSVYLDARL